MPQSLPKKDVFGAQLPDIGIKKIREIKFGRKVTAPVLLTKQMTRVTTAYAGASRKSPKIMRTVVAIHCSVRRSSAENHGLGVVSERTSGQLHMIRPTALHCPRASGIPSPLLPDETGSMPFVEPQAPHRYRWQVHNPHAF